MNNQGLNVLEPRQLWDNFATVCQIPRCSKNEQKIVQYLQVFGRQLNLETVVDNVNNVIIKKPASCGMEQAKTVILQAHLDMVPQKNNTVQHDFDVDPIKAYIDGEWVKADGTTLGADNGIGVAAIMAVLQAKDIKHGPIVALFTVDEETGMSGAFGLKKESLTGDILLNLDTEEEGELYIGCAGGVNTDISFNYTEEKTPNNVQAFKIIVSGLRGGHSGTDINLGRGNAIKLLNRILLVVSVQNGMRLAHFTGGTAIHNAIPREASAVVVIPKDQEGEFKGQVATLFSSITSELAAVDTDFKVEVYATELPPVVIDYQSQMRFIKAIYGCPHGVISMSYSVPGLVETSTNLGYAKSGSGIITIFTLQRSSVGSLQEDLKNMVRCVFELAGAKVEHNGTYPGWKPNKDSAILQLMQKVYQEKFGKIPEVKAIHAGLECGLLSGIFPHVDMISFGPTIKFPHSPDEKVKVASVKKFWELLLVTLERIPYK